eukprot:scaffold90040_cov31-Tisochrysis_lutea.AAC.2
MSELCKNARRDTKASTCPLKDARRLENNPMRLTVHMASKCVIIDLPTRELVNQGAMTSRSTISVAQGKGSPAVFCFLVLCGCLSKSMTCHKTTAHE